MTAGRDAQQPMPPQRPARQSPQRMCVGCRQRGDRPRLLRVVAGRGVDGGAVIVLPDPGARLPGRGAWLHPVTGCLDLAERRRAFPRALRVQGPVETTAVREHLENRRTTGPSTTVDEHRERVIT